jgi:hypothetical protein
MRNVTAKNYEGVVLTLVDEKSLKPVQVGEVREDFRGDKLTVLGGRAPHKEGSTGRVHVESAEGWAQEFFPGVVDCKWVKLETAEEAALDHLKKTGRLYPQKVGPRAKKL